MNHIYACIDNYYASLFFVTDFSVISGQNITYTSQIVERHFGNTQLGFVYKNTLC